MTLGGHGTSSEQNTRFTPGLFDQTDLNDFFDGVFNTELSDPNLSSQDFHLLQRYL